MTLISKGGGGGGGPGRVDYGWLRNNLNLPPRASARRARGSRLVTERKVHPHTAQRSRKLS